MKRCWPAVAIAAVVALTGGTGVAAADPTDRSGPAAAGAGVDAALQVDAADTQQLVDAIVVMRAQADLSSVRYRTRAQRLAGVERVLRATAERSQVGVLALLRDRQSQHRVAGVVPLWIANEVSVRATPSVIKELAARPDVREIRPNLTIEAPTPPVAVPAAAPVATTAAAPEVNLTNIGAPALWALGYHGDGVVVANMDTGVDATHPDLAASWRGGSNSWYDPNGQHPTVPTDLNGHGTMTMGVLVGADHGGTSIGVAPGAKWIAVKMFNDSGSTTAAAVHLGFQWLLDPDGNPATADAPNVVNNSWTTSTTGCSLEFQQDLSHLRAAGIVPVFAAGNSGPMPGSAFSPGNLPEALSVGATNDADVIASSSSRGPSSCSGTVSPKLAAPGVSIRTSDRNGGYYSASGTSLAAPHVAGALALLLNAFPGTTADGQEAALATTALDLGASGVDNDYGFGRLDVVAAYQWLRASPDFAVAASPPSVTTTAGGSASYNLTVTPANGFAGDVALSLSGLTASQATWSFTPPVVGGGTGAARLDIATSATIPPGTYPLTITGTSGSLTRSSTVTLVVPAPPDFSLSASPASRTVVAGSGASYDVGVSSVNGFTGDVSLSLSGLPVEVGTASLSPATVAGAGTSQLAIPTWATATPGSYPLTVTGTSGTTTHSIPLTLVVAGQPDFGLSANPASITVSRGRSASYTVTVSSVNGFAGNVTLSRSGLPSGASSTWSRNPVTAPGTSTLTVRTTSQTSRGTFTIRIRGTSGSLVHQATATLVVTSAAPASRWWSWRRLV